MRRQTVTYGAAGLAGVVLATALVVMVNWLGAWRYVRADWTSSKVYTLSDKSLNILHDLDSDIRVVVFMTQGSPLYDQVHELLDRYAAASSRLSVEFIDPDKEPLKTRKLAEEFGISAADTVVFTVGDRSKYVTSDQIVDYDYSGVQFGQGPKMKAFKGEEQFTAAILSLVSPTVPKVYLVSGHGEASLDAKGGILSERGIASLAELLRRENMEVSSLELFGAQVPDDADVVAILGPTQGYSADEVAALSAYLDRGGRLLVCLDPLITATGESRPTGLADLLEDHGVRIRDDLVVDPSRGIQGWDASTLYLSDFGDHAVTKGLDGIAVLYQYARSLATVDADGRTVTTLVETSADGWGETDLVPLTTKGELVKGDDDVAGPVAIAMAVDEGGSDSAMPGDGPESGDDAATSDDAATNAARLVVVGDSDFLTDSIIGNLGNLTFALNAFNWLGAQEEALGIPPREMDQMNLYLTSQQLTAILVIVLLLMPGAAIVLGIVVWRRRRR
jgi:ABC-type uncharacterized transport system involved in gliding motility auxiliary subunit